jgi:putative ABC transport system permease protein
MTSLTQEARYAFRTLRKRPGFVFIVVSALALTIGANTAIFSAVHSVLLSPLPFRDPGQLVDVGESLPGFGPGPMPFSAPDYEAFRARTKSFQDLGIYGDHKYELSGIDAPERIQGARVSASLWTTLGVTPLLGRYFTNDEDRGSRPVVLLSYGLWRSRFGADSLILGKGITLDRVRYTVVGVMPDSFVFPLRGPRYNDEPAELYTPISFTKAELEGWGTMFNNSVIGRLRPGVTVGQAQAEATTLMSHIFNELYPPELRQENLHIGSRIVPLRESVVGKVEPILLVLFGAVALVLLIGCADIASLLLTRAAARQREMSIRTALGASRFSLIRQVLIESLLLAITGGALGLIVAAWATTLLVKLSPGNIPLVETIHIDGPVLAFTLGLSVFTALLFGIFPALEASRADVNEGLREGARGQTQGTQRGRVLNALVVAQFALAVVLLVGAGLLLRSFSRLMSTDPGFRADHVLTMTVSLPASSYRTGAQVRGFFERLQEQISRTPGVKAAAVATSLPLDFEEHRIFAIDHESPATVNLAKETAHIWPVGNFFGAMGIPMRSGRAFDAGDGRDAPKVAIVSETFARHYFPGENAVGKRIKWGLETSAAPWLTVVGVAADVKSGAMREPAEPESYAPYEQETDEKLADDVTNEFRSVKIVLRTTGEPEYTTASIRSVMRALDPSLPLADITTMQDAIGDSTRPERFNATIFSIFAAAALVLAALGVAGVLAYSVAQRVAEIGLRMALGAGQGDVLRLFLTKGLGMALLGTAIGLAGSLALTKLLATLLYQTSPYDPWTLIAAPVVLGVVAIVSTLVPAVRASHVDPVEALRSE